MATRQRNMEAAQKKAEDRAAKEEEERIRNYNIRLQKETTKQNQKSARQMLMDKLKGEVISLKQSKSENRAIIEDNQDREMAQKIAMHSHVKNHERNLKERRRQEAEEKAERLRQELEAKIDEENRQREQRESVIARMEAEEMELIQRLQNTQSLQRDAYESLETAINGDLNAET